MKFWIPIIISIIATIISAITLAKSRSELLQVNLLSPPGYEPICEGQIKVRYEQQGKIKYEPLPQGVLIHLSFLNPSPNDIAYFGLCFHTNDPERGIIEAYTAGSAGHITLSPIFNYTDKDGYVSEIPFPAKTYGTFKANTYTPLFVFLPLRESDKPFPQRVYLQLLYAVRKFPYIGKKNHFSEYLLPLDLSNVESELQLQQKQVNKSIKAMQHQPFKSPRQEYSKQTKARLKQNPKL
ncbi:hypothetical protein [Ligilactobacillus aviarius]|uniref:Uncharacterized protein n=1 Tax=Ligilactobacillus aviarius TaxID=1606 RepID=A0A510X0X5_9LACO|nr:hypothetical protein [Ligilactobacillus aviarius]KRM38721.1 hypothetical protein FC33_GL000223 [Ligilactobacillus aviarius subsp. aviarius DSM 20655]GEK42320.1 hypothetical protein LAV01_11520 [Ligilactobacillus aviarius]